MTATLPLSISTSIRLQHWARQAGLEPKFDGEHWLLHLTPTPPVSLSQLPQSTTLHLVWSGLTWQLVGLTNASDFYDQWLITSCRSANNIMPITFFLPAFTASFFYSA